MITHALLIIYRLDLWILSSDEYSQSLRNNYLVIIYPLCVLSSKMISDTVLSNSKPLWHTSVVSLVWNCTCRLSGRCLVTKRSIFFTLQNISLDLYREATLATPAYFTDLTMGSGLYVLSKQMLFKAFCYSSRQQDTRIQGAFSFSERWKPYINCIQ